MYVIISIFKIIFISLQTLKERELLKNEEEISEVSLDETTEWLMGTFFSILGDLK